MKTINIFGKRMSILAILMTALIVGTASAAVFTHYGTLTSDAVTVGTPIAIIDEDGDILLPEGNGDLYFADNDEANFTIRNTGTGAIDVEIVTIVLDSNGEQVDDLEGLYVTLNPSPDGAGLLNIPIGDKDVTVTFTADNDAMPDDYKVQVTVIPV